jgi:hypothetical protein
MSFIPYAGAAASGGINLWFVTGICDAAEQYYSRKFRSFERKRLP